MAEKFYTLLTDIGLAKVANAQITQEKIDFVEMAVGDGGGSYYNPSSAQTTLVGEVWRGPIGLVGIDETNNHWINIESAIPSNQGGFFIREVGLFDEDGDLVAVGKYPETYKPKIDEGSSKDLYVRMIIEVSNASSITLKVDPTIIIATRKFVDDKIALSVGPINQSLQDLQVIVDENKDDLATHLADYTQLKGNLSTLKTTAKDSIPNIVNELFTNVSDGKSLVGGAITGVDENVVIPTDPTFNDLATAIGQISTGKKWMEGSANFTIPSTGTHVIESGIQLGFKPRLIECFTDNPSVRSSVLSVPRDVLLTESSTSSQAKNPTEDSFDLTVRTAVSPLNGVSLNIFWRAYE